MINVILNGRLGNILFQYAAARHLAIKNNTTIKFSIENYITKRSPFNRKVIEELSFFNIKPINYSVMIHRIIGRKLGIRESFYTASVYRQKDWGFLPEVLEQQDGIYLAGTFQSEKYFKDIEQIIRNDLRFIKEPPGREFVLYKEQITKVNSVSLHIRRRDYLSINMLNVCGMKYYIRSVDTMRDKLVSPRFFVFSDDIEWCLKNIRIPHCHFVNIEASRKNPIIDFQLMSLCKHHIISNSTFSWWAAWLSVHREKIVVTPNRWFNHEGMNIKALRDTIPDDWIRVDF